MSDWLGFFLLGAAVTILGLHASRLRDRDEYWWFADIATSPTLH